MKKKKQINQLQLWSVDTEDNSKGEVKLINFFNGVEHFSFWKREDALQWFVTNACNWDIWATNLQYDLINIFGVDDLSQVKNYKCYLLTEKERIWSCTDVLGLKRLPFDEYSHRQQEFIKKDIYEEFLGNNDSE